jgi:N6-adenosine-specific RNA methylase IME4
VELSLGVDLTGSENWQAASVTWYSWEKVGEDVWMHTQVVVRASGESLTVFLKGHHPFAVQGGATLFHSVRLVALGP